MTQKKDLETVKKDDVSRREFFKKTYSTALVGLLFGAGAATQAACDLPYYDYYYNYSSYYYNYSSYYYNYSSYYNYYDYYSNYYNYSA